MEERHVKFLLKLFYTALAAFALYFLFPWLSPFLLALGLAALLEPCVRFVMERLHLSRSVAAGLCTGLLVALLLGLCVGLLVRGTYEAGVLLRQLPALLDLLSVWKERLEEGLYRLVVTAPTPLRDFLRKTTGSLISQGVTVPGALYSWVMDLLVRVTAAAPGVVLFSFTTVLATYFSSAYRAPLLGFLRRQLPRSFRQKLPAIKLQIGTALGGWLRAQAILLLITFVVLTAAFLLMGVDLALLIAAGTALLDALPIFGCGTVLLPWALFSLLFGDRTRGLLLLLLYGVLWLTRSILEPRLVGDRVGLHPIAALFSMYGGFHFFGVAGMILAPIAAILLKQLHNCGLFRLWRD